MIKIIELCKQETRIWQVSWEKPPPNTLKLNTDRSALNNPGKIGGGGILRDHTGSMVYAFTIPLGYGTNNQAETLAAIHGIEWCIQHGYRRIALEIDSELLTRWLTHSLKPPWQLQQGIQDLINLTRQLEFFSCQHTYREANSTTDLLSKISHKTDVIHTTTPPNNYQQSSKEVIF
ncbi:14.7 kDa ribonuclease H-like protein [Solanum tuberosum]|uniref:14.7 kDa ribonuclease H-like protein n=1 Tax=Solanum tuberosum TaxID=4113 RepID=UPI00073A2FE1|nr:PREDICTED: 14.7 kDa ribonuclease H-like protein [Solanum tuberosum]